MNALATEEDTCAHVTDLAVAIRHEAERPARRLTALEAILRSRTEPHESLWSARVRELELRIAAVAAPFSTDVMGQPEESIDERFRRLAEQWQRETRHLSLAAQRAIHPAYQSIIGMGERALPYIFHRLQKQSEDWFWALRAITGADPVPVRDRGRVGAMARAWIEWGREHGHAA